MTDKTLCEGIIRNLLKTSHLWLTSWWDFDGARDAGIITKTVPSWAVLKALAYGKAKGYFTAEWRGVGTTPWAGSARRARDYWLTPKAVAEFSPESASILEGGVGDASEPKKKMDRVKK